MAKKYTNADVKSLKREEVINLLKENNIEFDSTQSLYSLRVLLVEKAEVADELVQGEESVAEVADENVQVEEPVEEKPVEEKPVEKPISKEEASAAFQNELSKRMATFGRAAQSAFSIELARRQGKVTGKLSFAEELKIRQNKVRK